MDDIELRIAQLVETIRRLMAFSPNGWVSWRRVAKEQEGSEEYAEYLGGYAQLDEWRHLFVQDGRCKMVKLSDAGLLYRRQTQRRTPSEIDQIAGAVRKYAARMERITLNVERVHRVARVHNKIVQSLQVELWEDTFPSETPVEFRPRGGGSMTHGKIVGQEADNSVMFVAFDNEVSDVDLPAFLSIDRAFLLNRLYQQLKELDDLPELIKAVFHGEAVRTRLVAGDNSLDVADELFRLPTPWTRLLWGPPGAGKTFAIGHLVARLMRRWPEDQILIVGPSNRSVDVALEQLIGQLDATDIGKRKILRFGYPRKTEILERPEILGPEGLDELNERARKLSRQLARAEREKASDEAIALLRAELLAVQEEVKNAVEQHIRLCRVVATTSTLASLPSSPISAIKWSTVVVDEVTMVTPAMCTYLASIASDRLLLAGDPRQLGPVYEQPRKGTQEDPCIDWMGRDVFDKSGVSRGEGEARWIVATDPRLVRITSQRRCAGEIWDRVRRLYPEVKHLTDEGATERIGSLPPCAGHAVAILDTSGCEAVAVRRQRSWQNQFTAELALEVASTVAAEARREVSVAIISPYRAQVQLLRRWIRQEQMADNGSFGHCRIECGTVHQFQGSDADVVIFDMVDGPGRSRIGNLLTGDTGVRLVNVALTRAKGKFILLADRSWCNQAMLRQDNSVLYDLIDPGSGLECVSVAPPSIRARPSAEDETESPIEAALLEALRARDDTSHVITQYSILDQEGRLVSRADFAFPDAKYAVYCDGRQWHLREDRWQRDWRLRNRLAELGWGFSVFTGSDIYRNVSECVEQIARTYRSRRAGTG